jgi:hypothetical protein
MSTVAEIMKSLNSRLDEILVENANKRHERRVIANFGSPEFTLSGVMFRHGGTIPSKNDCEIMMNHVGANCWRYFPGVGVHFINKD